MKVGRIAVVLSLLALSGCKRDVSAMGVCKQLEAEKLASACVAGTPGGLGSAAREKVDFDLPSVPGQKGQVMLFEKDEYYRNTTEAYAKMSTLVGRHQYGNPKARVFVQLNSKASNETGDATRAVVDKL
jgi:hypothetical protein